jgi:hypothetical protein
MAKGKPRKSRVKNAGAYAYPKSKAYPIDTLKRARAALAYAARKDTKGSYATVAKAVRRKYGNKIKTKR